MNETEQLEAARSFLGKLANGEMSWFAFEKFEDGTGLVQVDSNVNLTASEVELLALISVKPPQETSGPGGMPEDWGEEDMPL